jgi:hypothetical protein
MLLTNIENIINNVIDEYNKKLSEKFSLDSEELQKLWKEISGSEVKVVKKKKSDDASETGSVKSSKSKKSIEGGCPYVFAKGKNQGETCGSKPKDGGTYCGKHQKCEGVGQTEKVKSPVGKKSISESSEKKDKEPVKKKTQIVIRLNKKLDKYWNPETTLVFKSKEDRVVIGSFKDEKYEELTADDIVTCEKYGFKYENNTKNLPEEIAKTNLQAEHIENVLAEICKGKGDDESDEEDEIEEE